jgi:hypothetical protein
MIQSPNNMRGLSFDFFQIILYNILFYFFYMRMIFFHNLKQFVPCDQCIITYEKVYINFH